MPLGEMRRKDRAMGSVESEELLSQALVGRIATVGVEGSPYVIPVNFIYEPQKHTLFLHHHTSGHLLENLAHEPRVCFEVDEPGPVLALGPLACDMTQVYKSVLCFGRARVIETGEEKEQALLRLVQKYVERLMPDWHYEPEMRTLDSTVVVAVEVDTMTGKQRRTP